MKNYLYLLIVLTLFTGCKTGLKTVTESKKTKNEVVIDLVRVKNDQVQVRFTPSKISGNSATFFIPKIVPGTYSDDNYGKFITDFKALKKNGEALPVSKIDDNSWEIDNIASLYEITYLVNDSFDIENDHDVFSPSGSNILSNRNFILNLHAFIGYFNETKNNPYVLSVLHPSTLSAATSSNTLQGINPKLLKDDTGKLDSFYYNRYAEVTDSPIMYANQDQVTFKINDIDVLLSVYSPNKVHTAESLLPSMKKMMQAQKNFMGDINSTKKYSILLYLSEYTSTDAKGFGALEHNNSTVVVLPESLSLSRLEELMIDIVSHEFFHIITPLTIHSEEIHNFNYNKPKMSEHLWMYEGTTEYFAHLFQIKETLIDPLEFYKRIVKKIDQAKMFDDAMPFTKMSKNVLEEPYKSNYENVYQKGALISMCIDIIIRERSNGEKGILDLMKSLSSRYGANRPFKDDELIDVITAFTYPEVGRFLLKHVVNGEVINYADFFQRVGLEYGSSAIESDFFADGQIPYLSANQETNEIFFNQDAEYNSFLNALEIQPNDVLVGINGKKFDLNNAQFIFEISKQWKIGDTISLDIKRNGIPFSASTVIEKMPTSFIKSIIELPETDLTPIQAVTKKSWLN